MILFALLKDQVTVMYSTFLNNVVKIIQIIIHNDLPYMRNTTIGIIIIKKNLRGEG